MKLVVVYTGNGEGKTSSALGHILRALGYGKKCVVIQFLKGRKSGENLAQKYLKDKFKIYQFGSKTFVREIRKKDVEQAKNALSFAKEIHQKEKPFILVLDEINVAISLGLLEVGEVLEFLSSIKKGIIILTGRGLHPKIKKIANIITEMKEIKHDFPKRKAMRGFEF